MTVRVATVLSSRDWEPNLVAHARDSASLRVVLRAYQAEDIARHRLEIDVIVVGAETPWVSAGLIASWRRDGLGVVGIAAANDQPALGMLEVGGCDEVLPDTIDTPALVQAVRFAAPTKRTEAQGEPGTVVGVVGPRGAPGRTEVALAFALRCASTTDALLIDLDLGAPGLAVRLGLAPRPDIIDAADLARSSGRLDEGTVQRFAGLDVVTGSHRRDGSALRPGESEAIVRAASLDWDVVVLDAGPVERFEAWERQPDHLVLVVDGTAVGLVRAAELVDDWLGPAPALVVNRVDRRRARDVVDAARTWTGLEPVAVIPERADVRRAAASAQRPSRKFSRLVERLRIPA